MRHVQKPKEIQKDSIGQKVTCVSKTFHDLIVTVQVLPAPPGSNASKRLTVTRVANAFEEAEPEAATVAPRPAMVSGKASRFGADQFLDDKN